MIGPLQHQLQRKGGGCQATPRIEMVVKVGMRWQELLRAVIVARRTRKMLAARALMMMIAMGLLQPGREQESGSSFPCEKMQG